MLLPFFRKLFTAKYLPLLFLLIGSLVVYSYSVFYPKIIQAPQSIFTTIEGKKIELEKMQGQPVIITFWASDCANCIKEMPHLINLHNEFHNKGLIIIAIAMYYDLPNHVVEIAKAKQLPYPIVLDLKAEHAKAFGQVELIPATFLISPQGEVVMKKTGLFDTTLMKQKIKKILQG